MDYDELPYMWQCQIDRLEDRVAELESYSHRNGESDPPTISGMYWTEDEMLTDGFGRWDVQYIGSEDGRGTYSWFKYYGPIPRPNK